jgi:hypothetical protein
MHKIDPNMKLYTCNIEKHLRNGLDKKKDLNHELERHGWTVLPRQCDTAAHSVSIGS